MPALRRREEVEKELGTIVEPLNDWLGCKQSLSVIDHAGLTGRRLLTKTKGDYSYETLEEDQYKGAAECQILAPGQASN